MHYLVVRLNIQNDFAFPLIFKSNSSVQFDSLYVHSHDVDCGKTVTFFSNFNFCLFVSNQPIGISICMTIIDLSSNNYSI